MECRGDRGENRGQWIIQIIEKEETYKILYAEDERENITKSR